MTDLPPVTGLDVQRGLSQCGGRAALYQTLLRLYVQQNANFCAQLRDALARGDRSGAERIAHTLKGSSAQVGAEAVEQGAAELEAALRGQSSPPDVLALLKQLEQPLAGLLAALAPHLRAD